MNPIGKILCALTLTLLLVRCKEQIDGQLIFINESPQQNFAHPYFLYIPEEITKDALLHIIVEPNNSGFVSDELNQHINKAERIATREYYMGNYVARRLKYPLLVPAFPRSEKDWKIYTHSLDRDVMLQKGNALERIDLQLLAMVRHAKAKLDAMDYNVCDGILMTGFSASGTFVNRFTFIHPDKVLAAAAGGLNGLLMLPIREIKGKRLNYPLGTNDFPQLFDKPFDSLYFQSTPQMLFMGSLDKNDAIPYDDGYDEPERRIIYEVLGKEMQPDRWNKCASIYNRSHINAKIMTYEGLEHEHPDHVKNDVLHFFQENIESH